MRSNARTVASLARSAVGFEYVHGPGRIIVMLAEQIG
jgi:hypothetical protein